MNKQTKSKRLKTPNDGAAEERSAIRRKSKAMLACRIPMGTAHAELKYLLKWISGRPLRNKRIGGLGRK